MQKLKRSHDIQMEFEIEFAPGPIPKPIALKFSEPSQIQHRSSDKRPPLKFMADVLVGLSLAKLNSYYTPKQEKNFLQPLEMQFAQIAWKTIDPHFELYWKTQSRLHELCNNTSPVDPHIIENLERLLDETLIKACKPWGIEIAPLHAFLNHLLKFEDTLKTSLLFNFSLQFSQGFIEKMHTLFSFLFHLRALVGLEHNKQTTDSTHHSVRVDSISDYLQKADYIANDAALYLNFKRLSKPFSQHKGSDSRVEKLMIEPLERCFTMWTHHAVCLVENLTDNILSKFKNNVGLEEELYRIQMDWLLGAPAGLIFRIREELYGLSEGYEKVFWSDITDRRSRKPQPMKMCFELKEKDVFGLTESA